MDKTIVKADIKSVGGTKAINNTPIKVADDYVDPYLYKRWLSKNDNNHFGKYSSFEVLKENNKVKIYSYNSDENKYIQIPNEYDFVELDGKGNYSFKDQLTQNLITMKEGKPRVY